VYSFAQSGNAGNCPFCNSDRVNKTVEEDVEDFMKWAAVNDAASIYMLATHYYNGRTGGLQQDRTKAMEISVIRRRIITCLAFILKGEI
jgi:hypothetical protein